MPWASCYDPPVTLLLQHIQRTYAKIVSCAWEPQAEPITYLHAGMVQHDPSGLPAFLHRTAEGKVYPFNHGFRRVPPRFSHTTLNLAITHLAEC